MRSRLLFIAIVATFAVPLAWRVFWISPLYLSSDVRVRAEHALREVAGREGWILSDMPVLAVEPDGIVIQHRLHRRGHDPQTCYRINFVTTALHPCDD